jgi:serine/threonine-protein kinase HipA
VVSINTAEVTIWGKSVGAVAWNESSAYANFEYDSSFKTSEVELSPLLMPFAEKRIYSFPGNNNETFKGLPGLLADALPDKYGNRLINEWLARSGRDPESLNPVERLCFIGRRGMGALEFEPIIGNNSNRAERLEISSLVEAAQDILSERSSLDTNISADKKKALKEIIKVGTSAGGARPKAIIAFNQKSGEVRSGQTNAPSGFEHWLIKLDCSGDLQLNDSKDWGRIEMAYYNMAIDSGIDMMESRLLEENGRAHFMTKRFDREGSRIKHHIQTFCAMKHYDYNETNSFSYEQLFQTMRELHLPYHDAEQMFRRMVFNVMARNHDDHTKNFAFRLRQGYNWELAPAYDMCFASDSQNKWINQHTLSINGKRKNIQKEDILQLARSMNIKKSGQIIEEVNKVVALWNDYADAVNISPAKRDAINNKLLAL